MADPLLAQAKNSLGDVFVPLLPTERIARDPSLANAVLRHALDWLSEHTVHLSADEQRELARQVGITTGLYAAEYPVAYGGFGFSEVTMAGLREECGASGIPFSRHVLSTHDGPTPILLHATPEQRENWLRPLVEGRWTRCLAMTEEHGGSDLSAMETTARWSNGRWILSGRKFMISNAEHADMAVVLARAVSDRASGFTFFAFTTDTPGWKVRRRLRGMDPDYKQYEIELDSLELPDSAVVGGVDRVGTAVGLATEMLPHGRLNIAARAVGLARWALDVARVHADRRLVDGVKLSEKQYIREFLVRSYIKIETSRLLVKQAASELDEGRIAVREAAMAKLHATESACEVIDDAMQTLGGRGWLTEFGLERAYREARVFRMVDGSSELLKDSVFHLMPHTG